MKDREVFIGADAVARAAEFEQANANEVKYPWRNKYAQFDQGGNLKAGLSPSFAIAFAATEEPIVQASGAVGGVSFVARQAGTAGNGIVVAAYLPTEMVPIPASSPAAPSAAAVRLYAVRNADSSYLVEIVDGGALGTATYRVSVNGAPFGEKVVIPADSPSIEPPATFIFDAVGFVGGDPVDLTFKTGAQFNFDVRKQFNVLVRRAELVENWGVVQSDQLSAYVLASSLIGKVITSGQLEAGEVDLRGGSGGSRQAISSRLSAAAQFPDLSAATRGQIADAQKALAEL